MRKSVKWEDQSFHGNSKVVEASIKIDNRTFRVNCRSFDPSKKEYIVQVFEHVPYYLVEAIFVADSFVEAQQTASGLVTQWIRDEIKVLRQVSKACQELVPLGIKPKRKLR